MDNPFDFFDAIFCVSLPEDTVRRQHATEQFERVGIADRVRWISAPRPPPEFKSALYRRNPPGEFGCSLSHATVVVQAIHDRFTNVLVFEDDVFFHKDAIPRLRGALTELPVDWKGLFLGCIVVASSPHSKHLVKADSVSCTHAYALNGHTLLDFFKYWTYGITHGIAAGGRFSPVDVILTTFLSTDTYIIVPPIASQKQKLGSVIDGC